MIMTGPNLISEDSIPSPNMREHMLNNGSQPANANKINGEPAATDLGRNEAAGSKTQPNSVNHTARLDIIDSRTKCLQSLVMEKYTVSPSNSQYSMPTYSRPTKEWLFVRNSYLFNQKLENQNLWVFERAMLQKAFSEGVKTIIVNDPAEDIFDWVPLSIFLDRGNIINQNGIELLCLPVNYLQS
jgi:hypothetical protein